MVVVIVFKGLNIPVTIVKDTFLGHSKKNRDKYSRKISETKAFFI